MNKEKLGIDSSNVFTEKNVESNGISIKPVNQPKLDFSTTPKTKVILIFDSEKS